MANKGCALCETDLGETESERGRKETERQSTETKIYQVLTRSLALRDVMGSSSGWQQKQAKPSDIGVSLGLCRFSLSVYIEWVFEWCRPLPLMLSDMDLRSCGCGDCFGRCVVAEWRFIWFTLIMWLLSLLLSLTLLLSLLLLIWTAVTLPQSKCRPFSVCLSSKLLLLLHMTDKNTPKKHKVHSTRQTN